MTNPTSPYSFIRRWWYTRVIVDGKQPRWLFRTRLAIATIFIGILPFPGYVLWHGLKEAPSLASEIADAFRAIKRGKW